MSIANKNQYLNFLKVLQDVNSEVVLVSKNDASGFPRGTRFKIEKVILNSHIYIKPIDVDCEVQKIYVPFRPELMDEPRSPMNYLFSIEISKKDGYCDTDSCDYSRLYPTYRPDYVPTLELTDVQEDFLREYTYIIKAKKEVGNKDFIKGKEYHVINEIHSKNEHLIYVINEKGIKYSIPCSRKDFENPESFINNFDFYRRKGSHKVQVETKETSIKEYEEQQRQEREDFLKDIIEYPTDYKIVCKENVDNEDYYNDEDDCEDEEPFCFIAGKVYFGDLSTLEHGKLEIMDEMTRVNGLKHIVITEEEEFFDEDSWFNRHFDIVER